MVGSFQFLVRVFLLVVGLTLSAAAAEPKFVIGFPEDNLSNDWRAAQMREIQQELAKYSNVKFLMADAAGSVSQNIIDIETMVAQGAQLLFLGPRNPAAVAPVIARIRKQGVRIVLLTRKLETEDYDAYVSPDDFKIGYQAALFLAEKLNGQGTILMLEGVPTTTTAIKRKNGFLMGLDNYPGISVTSRIADYSRAKSILVMETLLMKGVNFDGIFAHNDAMAAGARLVLKKHGIDSATKPTVGIDFLHETRESIRKGEQLASFTYPTCGKIGVAVALDILRGKKVRRFSSVPFQIVTSDNVNDVEPIF